MSSLAVIYRPKHQGPTFTASEVLELTGITYRQLDWWTRTGRITPSVETGLGKGNLRLFCFEDVLRFAVYARLLIAGLSLEAAQKHLDELLTTDTPVRLAQHVHLTVDVAAMRAALQSEIEQMEER